MNAMAYSVRAVLAAAALAAGLIRGADAAPERPPNIIVLMDDQHRWDALGVVNPQVVTPNLDALARNGVFFDQAVCQAPMCIPSRNSMMLGLYPNQAGVLRNARGLPDDKLPSLPLPEVFRRTGYQTAGFGKTHWGLVCSTRGFETRFIGECVETGAVMMKDANPEGKQRYAEETKPYGGGEELPAGYIGGTSRVPEEDHRDGWVHAKCLEFIERGLDGRPLFLYLSFLKPHAGHNVPAGFEAAYDLDKTDYARQPPWTEDYSPHAAGINRRALYEEFGKNASEREWKLLTMRYRANCTWIDDMFGRALKALEEKGVLENALILYVSDHGEMLGERYYRFNKYCLYESSVRVPVILSGSALPQELRGTTDHRPAELVDVYPTLLTAAGLPRPPGLPGENLLKPSRRAAGFCALHEREGEAAFMWRTREYKLILRMKRRDDASRYTDADILGGEFYDLRADPREWNDVYGKPDGFPEVKKMMTGQLVQHLRTLAPRTFTVAP